MAGKYYKKKHIQHFSFVEAELGHLFQDISSKQHNVLIKETWRKGSAKQNKALKFITEIYFSWKSLSSVAVSSHDRTTMFSKWATIDPNLFRLLSIHSSKGVLKRF